MPQPALYMRVLPLLSLRATCLALPGVEERLSHGAPTFFAKRSFVMVWANGHHDNHFPHLWLAAPEGAQHILTTSRPEQFFRPPYVGHRGWIGVRLDAQIDIGELQDLCEDAYRVVAPPKLVKQLDDR